MCFKRISKNEELYVTVEDLETLHEKYSQLYKKVKVDEKEKNTPATYNAEMDVYIIKALRHDVRQISKERQLNVTEKDAQITARNDNLTPKYKRPWYKLFIRTPNRAMKIILDSEEIDANKTHVIREHVNELAKEEFEKLKTILSNSNEEPPPPENEEAVKSLPVRQPRKQTTTDSAQLPGQISIDDNNL